MDQGRFKPPQDVFLGTADIIHRVTLAQANPVSRWVGGMRFYAVLSLSLVVGLSILMVAWRTFTASPKAAEVADQSADGDVPQEILGPSAANDPVPSHKSHARPGAAPAPPADRAGSQPIRVFLLVQPGAMWLDGHKVAHNKHAWSGHVAPGEHQLAVRIGGHVLRHTFVVEGQPLAIVVDPVKQSFKVSVGHSGHRAGRWRSH
jgi:hypothetical protein